MPRKQTSDPLKSRAPTPLGGRPPIHGEKCRRVSAFVPISLVESLDKVRGKRGLSRSLAIVEAIEAYVKKG